MRSGDSRNSRSVLRGLSIGPKLIVRQLRFDFTLVAALFVVVLIAAAVLAAAPRMFDRMSDNGLRHAVTEASPIARNLKVSRASRILASRTDPVFANVERAGETFLEDEMPATLQKLIKDQLYLVDSPRFTAQAMPDDDEWPFPVFMKLRYQQEILDHVQLVDGRLPEPHEPILVPIEVIEDSPPLEGDEDSDESDAGTDGKERVEQPTHELLPVYEVAVTAETLNDLELGVGGQMILRPDASDVAFRDVPRSQLGYRLVLEVSGVIEPIDPDGGYWFQDMQLHRSRIVENPDFRLIYSTGLMAPPDYARLLGDAGGVPFRYEWRYFIDPAGIDAGSVGMLASDVRNLGITYPRTAVFRRGRDTVATGLGDVIDGYSDKRNTAVAMLALVSLGMFVAALALVTQLAALVAARQGPSLYLLRSRGASRSQLVLSRLTEGLFVSVPAGLLGLGVAINLVTAHATILSLWAATAVVVGATGLMVTAALPAIRSDLGTMRIVPAARSLSLRRKVVEALVVAVAVTAALLLRRRGLGTQLDSPTAVGFDPLLAAAPSLLALAVGIVTLRLYVYPIRLLAWLAGKRRDIVAFVGLRRILQQSSAARLPLLVVVLATAVALFAGTIRTSIAEGQQRSAWHTVGADFRVSGAGNTTPLDRDLDLSALDSIEAIASGALIGTFHRSEAAGSVVVEFLALETAQYASVVAGTRADPDLPPSIVEPPPQLPVGSDAPPVPALVQQSWMEERSFAVGDTFELDIGRRVATFSIAAARDSFPSLSVDTAFVVADAAAVQAAGGGEMLPSMLYIRAPDDALAQIQAEVNSQAPASTVMAQRPLLESIRSSPFVAGVFDGLRLTFWLAALFAVIAVVAAVVLTSRARARDHGYLRALGLAPRQAVAATLVEQAPPVIVAALAGSALGAGTAVLFAPGIDLAAFTGTDLAVELLLDVSGALIVVSALVVATSLAVAASSRRAGRVNLGEVLRLGER